MKRWKAIVAELLCVTCISNVLLPPELVYAESLPVSIYGENVNEPLEESNGIKARAASPSDVEILLEEDLDDEIDEDEEESLQDDEILLEDDLASPSEASDLLEEELEQDIEEASPSEAERTIELEDEKISVSLSTDDMYDLSAYGWLDIMPYMSLDVSDDSWSYFMPYTKFGVSREIKDGYYGKQLMEEPGFGDLAGLAEVYNMLDIFCSNIEEGVQSTPTSTWDATESMSFSVPVDQMDGLYENIKYEMAVDQWICMNAYFWDHPYYRGVSSTFNADFTNISASANRITGKVRIEIELKCDDLEGRKAEYEEIREIARSVEIPEGTKYEQAKALHDYVCSNISYDLNGEDAHSVYGALTQKKAACDGYARTYKTLCDLYDIENVLIVGDGMNSDGGYDGHMWNLVRMDDDQWYAVDTTWDQGYEEANYDFFMVGEDTVPNGWEVSFGESHLPNTQHVELGIYSATLEIPNLSAESYEEPQAAELSFTLYDSYNPETEEYGGQIQDLTYSYGSFSWTKNTAEDLIQDQKTDFDQFYMKVDCSLNQDLQDITIDVKLPDGFSFSETELVSEKPLTIETGKKGVTYTSTVTVYPIYAESYYDRFNLNAAVKAGSTALEDVTVSGIPVYRNMAEGMVVFNQEGYRYDAGFAPAWFAKSSYQYDHEIAKYSLALSSMEYCAKEDIEESWRNLGFSGVRIYEYDDKIEDILYVNFSIAKKKIVIDGKIVTLVAVPMRGTVTGGESGVKEWIGNLYLGTSEEHEGFERAKTNVEKMVYQYKDEICQQEQDLKLLLCGHSRAAATANLLGAELDRSQNFGIAAENIYTYTFATPNVTTKDKVRDALYDNIFNIVDFLDLVPAVPLKAMGYDKYGVTAVIANRLKEDYEETKKKAGVDYSRYTGENYEPLELADYMDAAMDTAESAKDELTSKVFEDWTEELRKSILRKARNKLVKGIFARVNVFMLLKNLADGADDVASTIEYANKVICTHKTASYMAWMENTSGLQTEERYKFKFLQIACPVDVEIYNSAGRLVGRITSDGVDTSIENGIYVFMEEDAKCALLPGDEDYSVKIIGTDSGTMNYSIIEYDEDGEMYRIVTTSDIEVADGQVFRGEVDCITGTEKENYKLITDGQETILPERELSGNECYISVSVEGNGTVRGTGFYLSGETVQLSAVPGEALFEGWYLEEELVSDDLVYSFTASTDVTLQARFTPIAAVGEHQVIFDSKGGTFVETQIVADGGKVQEPEIPVRDGYQFSGWYYHGEKYNFTNIVTENMVLEARWVQNSIQEPSEGGDGTNGGGDDNSAGNNGGSNDTSGSGGSGGHGGGGGGGSSLKSSPSASGYPSYVIKGGIWVQTETGKWQYINERIYTGEWAALENPYADTAAGQLPYDWFCFDENGFMRTGWYTDAAGNTYYLHVVSDNTLGHMHIGWSWIDDNGDGVYECYYFEEKSNGYRGKLYTNTTIDGYDVNEKGQWVDRSGTVMKRLFDNQ